MKKFFNSALVGIGIFSSAIVVLLLLYVVLFTIDETTGKSIAGSTDSFKGKITGIACYASTQDISFTIEGSERSYYINRGLEKGLSCDQLREKLVGKEVEISHATFFANVSTGHINRLACNNEVVYSELK
jgi:hypothetical protein